MTSLFSLYGTDKSMETQGVWVYPAGDEPDAPAFKVARSGGVNSAFDQAQTVNLKAHQRLIAAAQRNPTKEVLDIIKEATKKSFVGTCLLDWKNVTSVEGNELLFSKDNAMMLMNMLPDLYNELLSRSQDIATFQREAVEQEAKN